jgi:hypothetical protein
MSTTHRNQIARTRVFRQLCAAVIASHGLEATAAPAHARGSVAARFLEDVVPTPDVAVEGRPDIFVNVSASLSQNRYIPSLRATEQDAALAGATMGVHVAYGPRAGTPEGVAVMSLDAFAALLAGSSSTS